MPAIRDTVPCISLSLYVQIPLILQFVVASYSTGSPLPPNPPHRILSALSEAIYCFPLVLSTVWIHVTPDWHGSSATVAVIYPLRAGTQHSLVLSARLRARALGVNPSSTTFLDNFLNSVSVSSYVKQMTPTTLLQGLSQLSVCDACCSVLVGFPLL